MKGLLGSSSASRPSSSSPSCSASLCCGAAVADAPYPPACCRLKGNAAGAGQAAKRLHAAVLSPCQS